MPEALRLTEVMDLRIGDPRVEAFFVVEGEHWREKKGEYQGVRHGLETRWLNADFDCEENAKSIRRGYTRLLKADVAPMCHREGK